MDVFILAALTLVGIPLLMAVIGSLSEKPSTPRAPKDLNRDSASRAATITGIIWAVLTVVGVIAVLSVDFYSTVASDRGDEISHAFTFLTALAVPVAALVIAILVYSVLRRATGNEIPSEDGEYYEGRGPFPKVWFGASALLTVAIIIYPGLVTLPDVIHKHKDPDLVVDVQALQWTWLVAYPDEDIENQVELVLPVDRKVTFNITSRDVVHSFWVPAFLMKIDAIPGHTTTISLIATEEGDYTDRPVFRVQCAELCGVSHAGMRIPVRVVSQEEFDDWVAEKQR